MVSVFLRLLEHHSGTLILTTNSIRSIDEAFLSRFSMCVLLPLLVPSACAALTLGPLARSAITYPNLDRDKRRTIWRSFLELAGVGVSTRSSTSSSTSSTTSNGTTSTISPTYLDSLAAHSSLNGRQIKNAVRTAQALARSQGLAAPGEEHLDVVIKAVEAFKRDLEEADEQGVYEVAGEGCVRRLSRSRRSRLFTVSRSSAVVLPLPRMLTTLLLPAAGRTAPTSSTELAVVVVVAPSPSPLSSLPSLSSVLSLFLVHTTHPTLCALPARPAGWRPAVGKPLSGFSRLQRRFPHALAPLARPESESGALKLARASS